MEWRVLVVDDQAAADVIELIAGNKVVAAPDQIVCVPCVNFSEALEILRKEKFDLVILDLKDHEAGENEPYAGETVYGELKKLRFIPVVFHTGYAFKVSHLASPFVKVVTRGDDPQLLRSAIKDAFDTKLPILVRHIEEEQRKYMWESAEKIWSEQPDKNAAIDLVYLLARRLANLLSGDVIRNYLETDDAGGAPKSDKIHAVELYVWPPLSKHILFGDIFKKNTDGRDQYFVALTPSCDHVQKNADFVLFAKCKYLKETPPGISIKADLAAGKPPSATSTDKLQKFIRDNASPTDRFKYLPGTNFIPDLIVDLQDTMTVVTNDLNPDVAEYERIASLDSPFSESLQSKMTRYFGRIGTPDIDADLAFERFKARA